MSRRTSRAGWWSAFVAFGLTFGAASVSAGQVLPAAVADASGRRAEWLALEPVPPLPAADERVRLRLPAALADGAPRDSRPGALVPLYVAFASLQVLDAHSTSVALSRGGRESNPFLADAAREPAVMLGLKAGATIGTVWLTERLWKKKHRKAAVLLMLGINVGYALIAAHNYRVAHR